MNLNLIQLSWKKKVVSQLKGLKHQFPISFGTVLRRKFLPEMGVILHVIEKDVVTYFLLILN